MNCKSVFRKILDRSGFAMTELLLASVISMAIIGVCFTLYTKAKNNYESTEVLRQLIVTVENVRTFYAFDGSYAALSTVKNQDLYKKEFFSRYWRCSGTKCEGPGEVTAELAPANSGNNFTLTVKVYTPKMCTDLATYKWNSVDAVKIDTTTYKDNNLPVTAKNAMSKCKSKGATTIQYTFK